MAECSGAGNLAPQRPMVTSRRSSKRSVHCDDDMSSDSEDDKPLAPVALAAAAALQNSVSIPPALRAALVPQAPQEAHSGSAKRKAPQVESAPPAKKLGSATAVASAAKVKSTDEAVTARSALPVATKRPLQAQADRKEAGSTEQVPVVAQKAQYEAKLAQLQKEKQQLLENEDYIGAHHLKEKIKEQEDLLRALGRQLDGMPTPARRASLAASKVSVNSGRSGKSPGKTGRSASATLAPNANAFQRPQQFTAALNRLAASQAQNSQLQQNVSAPTPASSTSSRPATGSAAEHTPTKEPATSAGSPLASPSKQDENMSPASSGGESLADEDIECTGQWRAAATAGMVELTKDSDAKPGELPFMIPRDMFGRLYPYQRAGVAWMARLFQGGQGGVLADEMGLGKTVQVCAFLNGARKAGASHALLLLPLTLLDQWAREARKWCPGWPVHVYYGVPGDRTRALRRLQRPQGGLLLTSYQTMSNSNCLFEVPVCDEPSPKRYKKREKGKRRKLGDDDENEEFQDSADEEPMEPEIPGGGVPELGNTKPWDVVVCDEAHRLKNMSSLLGKTMRSVKSSCRILLTGTPVQNALQDLWSLMDFAQPGLLGNHTTFVKQFSDPIDRGSFGGASTFQVELKKHLAEQLRSLITPHLLRRTKVNAGLMAEEGEEGDIQVDGAIAEDDGDISAVKLPPKRETIIWLEPSDQQLDTYKKILERSDVIREACSKSKLGFEVFRAIGLLKRLCNHPALLLTLKTPGAWRDYLSAATAQLEEQEPAQLEDASVDVAAAEEVASSDAGVEALCQGQGSDDAEAGDHIEESLEALDRTADAILSYSSKLKCLNALLPALKAKGHRTLIFCQSLKMLDLVQICCLKPNGLRCLRIDGQTGAQERADKVNKFNKQRERFSCMLLTTSVGGVGLNLVSADRVVIVDPAWNPAIDAQAVDRAFRIGQDKEVKVYRLIMSGLIEDKMFRLQVFKMGLTKTALESSDQTHRYFTQREIKALFEWTEPSEGETRKMLLEKHGDTGDADTQEAAAEDGSMEDGWFKAGPAVALSDFAQLYGGLQKEEEPDAECEAMVEEAKVKLGAADEKLQQKSFVRKAAEENQQTQIAQLAQVNEALDALKEKKARALEAVKESNSEAVQERRSESAAQTRVDKAQRSNANAEDKHLKAKQQSIQLTAESEAADKSAAELLAQVAAAEKVFKSAHEEARTQQAIIDNNGSSTKDGIVEVRTVAQLRALQKALERAKSHIDKMTNNQVELNFSEQELMKAEVGLSAAETELARLGDEGTQARTAELNAKKFRKERERAEVLHAKAKEKVESARDAAASAINVCVETGAGFAASLQGIQDRSVKVDQVKAVQSKTKAAFKQFSASFAALRKASEGHSKAVAAQRKACQKAAEASSRLAEAERILEDANNEYEKAVEEEKTIRESRIEKEKALGNAELEKAKTETEETELKRQREELKAAVPAAKEAVKATKAAEKEALMERQALHSKCSKVERQHSQMEEAKNSAMQILQAEKYDANQVEKAYESKNE